MSSLTLIWGPYAAACATAIGAVNPGVIVLAARAIAWASDFEALRTTIVYSQEPAEIGRFKRHATAILNASVEGEALVTVGRFRGARRGQAVRWRR